MSTTTTNFGWTIPSDTDLVKDGASAMRTLGNGIDSSMADLKGGTTGQVLSKASGTDMDFTWVAADDTNAIQNAIIDSKGDLIVGASADTPARLPIGSNGYVLTADSSETYGVKWAAGATSGGETLLHTVSMSGASTITQSSISGDYKHLKIVFNNISAAGGDNVMIKFNGDSGSNYRWLLQWYYTSGAGADGPTTSASAGLTIRTPSSNSWDACMYGVLNIYDYTRTTGVAMDGWISNKDSSGNFNYNFPKIVYNNSAAISSISIVGPSSFDQGNMYIYGVK